MVTVRLRKLPSGGASSPQITPGMTLKAFADKQGISNRDICIDGQTIAQNEWPYYNLSGGERIVATTSVKGA